MLGTVGEIRTSERGPTRVMLSRSRVGSDLPLIFFQEDVLAASGIADVEGRVRDRVTGEPSIYVNRTRKDRSSRS